MGRRAPLAIPGVVPSCLCGGLFEGRGLVDGRGAPPGTGLVGLGGGLAFAAAGLRRTRSSSDIQAPSYGDAIVEQSEEVGEEGRADASSSVIGTAIAQTEGTSPMDEVILSLVVLL